MTYIINTKQLVYKFSVGYGSPQVVSKLAFKNNNAFETKNDTYKYYGTR